MSILITIAVFDAPIDLVGRSEGTTLFVNATGSGGAYASIQEAINDSSDGDTIFVYSGTYYENIDVNKDINLKGESNQTTIIDGMDGDDVIIVTSPWANITDFTIMNCTTGIYMPNSNAIIENNILGSGETYGIEYGWLGNHIKPIIRNNIFLYCSNVGIDVRYGVGGLIINNTIYMGTFGSGIRVNGDPTIIGNTIRTNGGNSFGISLTNGADCDIIENNIYSKGLGGLYSCAIESQYGVGRIYNCSFDYPEALQEFTFGYGADLTLYNSTYDSIYYYSSDSDSVVTSKWWVDVQVKDKWGYPVAGAEVWIENNTGAVEYHGFTNSSGRISLIPLTERSDWIDHNISHTPHTFTISNGTENGYAVVDIHQNTEVEIILGVNGSIYNVDKDTYHLSIQEAVDNADAGDDIEVYAGTYYENILIYKPLNLTGFGPISTVIDGGGSGNVIEITANYVNLTGFTIKNGNNGIYSHLTYYQRIVNNIITSTMDCGIYLESSAGNNIIDNEISGNEGYGIRFKSSFSIINKVKSNIISKNNVGIYTLWIENVEISGNHISNNTENGLLMSSTSVGTIHNNTFIDDGIFLKGDSFNHFNSHDIPQNNTVNEKPIYYYKDVNDVNIDGISVGQLILANCNDVIIGNLQIDKTDCGIEIAFSDNITISDCSISTGNGYGVYFTDSSKGTFFGNNFSYNKMGLSIYYSSNNSVEYNIVTNNTYGIAISWSNYNVIEGNNISYNNDYGIYPGGSYNVINNNTIFKNNDGFHLTGSPDILIANNTISWNVNGMSGTARNTTILGNNISDNWRGIYLVGASSRYNTIEKNAMGNNNYGIVLQDSLNCTTEKNTLWNNHLGIYAPGAKNCTILSNDIFNSNTAIWLWSSANNNTLIDNNLWNNSLSINIGTSSHNNNIRANKIFANRYFEFGYGIYIKSFSNNNMIVNNSVSESYRGIYITDYSNGSIIKENDIMENDFGIVISNSFNNKIYHNEFLYNENHSQDYTNNGNQWDNGYPSGGNYWSGYYDLDEFSGPFQDIPGSDGIGDSPYVIDSDSIDNYPFIEPTPDTLPPRILLNSPGNNTLLPMGVTLDFLVYDGNLDFVNYSVNQNPAEIFLSPHDISTEGWMDGDYLILISAIDFSGNSISSLFFFTIDSTPPAIWLDPDINHSTIPVGRTIKINVTGSDVDTVLFSLPGVGESLFHYPYIIDTSGWIHGLHTITIYANDTVGNQASMWFEVIVDASSPEVIDVSSHQLYDYSISTENIIVNFTFSEPMNQTNTEDFVSISPSVDYDLAWDDTSTILTVSFIDDIVSEEIQCDITISRDITDLNGISMSTNFVSSFLRSPSLDTDGDGIPDELDDDDDNDGVNDIVDLFPIDPTEWNDFDRDGIGDNADSDDDNDGVTDINDAFPLNPAEHNDMDSDGIGDNSDSDIDGDGQQNNVDDFPFDVNEWNDFDRDGVGDNSDGDDDNDGVPDERDDFPFDPTRWGKETKEDFTFYILLLAIVIIVTIILVVVVLRRIKEKQEPILEQLLLEEPEMPPPPPES